MKKRVLLLAVSCKTGGLCPGGLDMDDPSKWIRLVKDDEEAGAIQGFEINFAKPLDIIEFDGKPKPQGVQQENWVIVNKSCRIIGSKTQAVLGKAYQHYAYKGFWGNNKAYLNETEFASVNVPSESIMKVSNVRIYQNVNKKAKIDFDWSEALERILGVSMTDQEYFHRIKNGDVNVKNAFIVTSIPKKCDWTNPTTGTRQAYKFVSKIYEI